jgi:hypothetical protein
VRLLLQAGPSVRFVAYARRLASRTSALTLVRHLDPGALIAVALGLAALAAGLGHVSPLWTAAIAIAGVLVGNNARRRNIKPKRPTVDHLRSLLLSVLAILLAAAGLAVVAPSLLAAAQSRLLH